MTMQTELERHFIRFQRTGDPTALAEVFDRAAPKLLLLAIHLTGDELGAEDLVQSTFLRLIESAGSYDASQPLLPWASTILANEARRSWRRGQLELDRAQPPRAPVDDPRELAQAAETFDVLTRAIDDLDESHRAVVNLKVVHGMKPGEIARVLSLSPELARTRLSRGLKRLRGALPPSLAGSVAVAISARGLAQVRAEVLAHARDARPAVAASGGVASVWFGIAAVAAAAGLVTLAALLWLSPPDAPRTVTPASPPVAEATSPSTDDVRLGSTASTSSGGTRREVMSATATERDREPSDITGEAWRLSGRVRSREGTPIADAEVRASVLHGCDVVTLQPVRTDVEGRYALSVDALRSRGELGLLGAGLLVQASAPGHWPHPAELLEDLPLEREAMGSFAQDFVLTPGRTVGFDLRTPEGAAPSGVVLARLVPSSASEVTARESYVEQDRTDLAADSALGESNAAAIDLGQSTTEWSAFDPGEPLVLPVRGAGPFRLEARCNQGLLFHSFAVLPADGDLGPLELQRFSVIAGRLVGPEGHPVPHLNLRVTRLGTEGPLRTETVWRDGAPQLADVRHARTDAEGRFHIASLLPGRYALELEYSFLSPVRYELEADAAPRDFALDGQVLVLRTVDGDGQLVPGLELRYACEQDGERRTGRLDVNDVGGTFELFVPFDTRWRFTSGTWRIALDPLEHVASRQRPHQELALLVTPAIKGGRLAPDVRDDTGRVVETFELELHHLDTGHDASPLTNQALASLDLPAGGYEVTLSSPANAHGLDAVFLPKTLRVDVEPGQTCTPRVTVERGGRVEFLVEPGAGPVLGAAVTVELERNGRWSHIGGILQEHGGAWQLSTRPDLGLPCRTFIVLPGGPQRLRLRAGEALSSAVECVVQPGALSRVRVSFDAP